MATFVLVCCIRLIHNTVSPLLCGKDRVHYSEVELFHILQNWQKREIFVIGCCLAETSNQLLMVPKSQSPVVDLNKICDNYLSNPIHEVKYVQTSVNTTMHLFTSQAITFSSWRAVSVSVCLEQTEEFLKFSVDKFNLVIFQLS